MAESYDELRERALRWHRRRFPDSTMERTGLKLTEEVGELSAALIGVSGSEHPERADRVGEEAADVLAVLMVLLGRFFPEIDVLAEWSAKLDRLEARVG